MELNVRDAARYLNVPEDAVYRWIDDEAIPFSRVNDQFKLNTTELLEWASARGMRVAIDAVRDPANHAPSLAAALKAGGVRRLEGLASREAALEAMAQQLPLDDESDRPTLREMVLARELLASSGLGDGIAIPHVRAPIVVQGAAASVSVWYLEPPVDFGAPDKKPVGAAFLLVTPTPKAHLQLLSRVAAALHDPAFNQALREKAPLERLFEQARRLESDAPPGAKPK